MCEALGTTPAHSACVNGAVSVSVSRGPCEEVERTEATRRVSSHSFLSLPLQEGSL